MTVVLIAMATPPIFRLGSLLWGSPGHDRLEIALTAGVGLLWLSVIGFFVRSTRSRAWVPFQLRADRDAGTLELVERNAVTGRDRREVFPLDQLAGLTVESISPGRPSTVSPPAFMADATGHNVRVTVRLDQGSRRPRARTFALNVSGIDRREEVADLACRLGAAAGLSYRRVVRSDPRDIELEISPVMGAGHERIPSLDTRANYAADVVSAAGTAAASEDRIPPFDPARFPCDHEVAKWSPTHEVRFRKPFRFGALGCLPFALAGLLAGPAVFMAIRSGNPSATLSDVVAPSLLAAFFGLVIGGLALAVLVAAMPRLAVVDWTRQTVSIGGLFSQRSIPLSDVTAVEARCVRTHHTGGKNSSSYDNYRCEVLLHLREGARDGKPVLLVRTMDFREDPDTPYRGALPLVAELAESLRVERRVTNYS